MRPRTRQRPDTTRPRSRPRPTNLALRPCWPRGLNIPAVMVLTEKVGEKLRLAVELDGDEDGVEKDENDN